MHVEIDMKSPMNDAGSASVCIGPMDQLLALSIAYGVVTVRRPSLSSLGSCLPTQDSGNNKTSQTKKLSSLASINL